MKPSDRHRGGEPSDGRRIRVTDGVDVVHHDDGSFAIVHRDQYAIPFEPDEKDALLGALLDPGNPPMTWLAVHHWCCVCGDTGEQPCAHSAENDAKVKEKQ